MITYLDKNTNGSDYNVLFEKASVKLGLMPIIEKVRNEETLKDEDFFYKRTYDQSIQEWVTVPCFDVDENGKPIRDPETGEIIFHGVDVTSQALLDGDNNPIKPITTLNEYFQHIRDLAGLAIGQGRSGSDPYFLRLPLDEPYFEINANTRGITVPGELSQIAVRGDKLAEVVFFRIDRYYDAVDLNTRHIYIEWEAPDGKGGVRRGISRDFLRDTQSEKDKIIFGWAIGDELTEYVGTIRFAVRFVEWFDNKEDDEENRQIERDTAKTDTQLLYSFSSLPATISVVDSLNYSLFEDDEALAEYNSLITEENIGTIVLYLEDSDSDTTSETAPAYAEPPVFVEDLVKTNSLVDYSAAQPITGKSDESKINLVNGKLELVVEAKSTDGGQISYVFGHIQHTEDEGTGIAPTGAKGLVAKIGFRKSNDAFDGDTFNTNKMFYILKNGAYIVATEDLAQEEHEKPNPEFFERVASVEIMKPGHYYAIADNKVGGKKARSVHSSYFYVPWAGKPVVEEQMVSRFVPQEKKYKLQADENFNEAALDNRGKTNVRVVLDETVHNDLTVTLRPTISVENNDSNGLTYVWYKHSNNHLMDGGVVANAESYARPDGLKDDEWNAREAAFLAEAGWEVIEGANEPFYETSEEGCYAVKIINDFNNDVRATDLLDAGACRVTKAPQIPAIDWNTFKTAASQGVILDHIDVSLNDFGTAEEKIDYDSINYVWHKVTVPDTNNPGFAEDLEEATMDDMFDPAGPLTFNAQGVASIPFTPKLAGAYFLVITSTLNDATVIYNGGEDPLIGTIQISA